MRKSIFAALICGELLVSIGIVTGSINTSLSATDVPLALVALGTGIDYMALAVWAVDRFVRR